MAGVKRRGNQAARGNPVTPLARLVRWLRSRCKKRAVPPPPPKSPMPENPYRRFYSKNRSFEELVRRHKK